MGKYDLFKSAFQTVMIINIWGFSVGNLFFFLKKLVIRIKKNINRVFLENVMLTLVNFKKAINE